MAVGDVHDVMVLTSNQSIHQSTIIRWVLARTAKYTHRFVGLLDKVSSQKLSPALFVNCKLGFLSREHTAPDLCLIIATAAFMLSF